MDDQFFDAFLRISGLFMGFLADKGHDKEFSDDELEQIKGELEVLTSAVECEIARRQEAYEAAGGADVKGDTNRAQKIKSTPESAAEYIQNLKV